ncbi:hypothetical protein OTU49_004368 [Cherax quadricarinatus]|uniref:Uncharacterized protein n=5 Tax=Cherax quadricarinatus TaxID=27406 RepID=A0AAW0X0Z9_CHEQU
MEYLLKQLQGPEAWRASWYSSERNHDNLTRLLVRASYRGATLTAAFIQQRGGSVTSLTASGHTALHIALDAGHMQTVECLVRHMGANLFLCDGLGRLPLLLCPQDKRDQLLEDALCQAYRVLDFRMGKIRSGLEKQNLAYVMVLMAVLYNEADFFSSEANLPCMKHGLFPDVHLSSERTTSLSTEADLSSVETFPSRKWKEVFLQMAIMLRQIEERQFLDDNWLKDLLSCLSQKRIERNDTVTAAEVNDDLDLDEELFFLLIEELKKKHHSLSSENHKKDPELEDLLNSTLHRALRLCCECDLLLLTHLLFTVAAVPVDEIIDPVSGSTALHIVASHGRIGLMDYLLSRNASPSVLDHAGRTPAHLAYMFGHSAVGDCLCEGFEESRSKAGNCPKDLLVAFKKYLKMYHLEKNIRVPMHELNDPLALTRAHLQQFKWKWRSNFQRAVKNLHVDFTSGEAQEVQTILTEEIKKILSDQARINPLWEGDLQVLGSSADNLRLYAPDEFDCNVVLKKISGFPGGGLKVKHTPFPREVAEMKGYSTCVCVTAVNESLKSYIDGPNIVRLFSNDFLKCLENFKFSDNRLSFVPPGTRKTQVGISVSFAWEGSEFPLLLIEVDIVPILKIPWPGSQQRPPMTPPDVDTLYISNTGDGEWRYSFAAIESRIFRALPGNRRLVFLACKLLIVTLKVVSWAPRDVKELFTYWNGRRFKIPAPAGFILKNTFLQEMEDVKDNAEWDTQKLYERMCSVFSRMCIRDYDVTSGTTRYFHGKVHAYFGGNTEKPSIGLAAPEILAFLESLKAS